MPKTLFTLPGKIGDNLFRFPIIYQYWKQKGIKSDVCLDINSKVMVSLLENQEWCNKAFLSEGIQNYDLGGIPYHFGKDDEFKKKYDNVYHLGFRPEKFRHTNLTTLAYEMGGCDLDTTNLLTEPSIKFDKKPIKNLCIHIDSSLQWRADPAKYTLLPIFSEVAGMFENVYFVGKFNDMGYYREWEKDSRVTFFNDNGDLNKVVDLLSESLLYGTYSSMWALANLMKIEQIVVRHPTDPCCIDKSSCNKESWFNPNEFEQIKSKMKEALSNG